MEVIVRRAHENEAKAVAKVHWSSWNETYSGVYPQWFIDERPLTFRHGMWQAYLADDQRVTAVAELDGEMCGLVRYGRPAGYSDVEEGIGELLQLYVMHSRHGVGVGTKLLQHAEQQLQAAGYKTAFLFVVEQLEGSVDFYTRHGWEPRGVTEDVDYGGFKPRMLRMFKELA